MAGTRLFYVDDSGAADTGFVTFSWCEVAIEDWRDGLAAWLAWRAAITDLHQIPKNAELHATKFANGRGAPSLDQAWNRSKANRQRVMDSAFTTLAAQPWLGIGTVFSETRFRRHHYERERERVYTELVLLLDRRLAATGDFGIVVMDGDGTNESYITAHRQLALDTRQLIEDPAFQRSHRSQWVQIADLVAYATYQHLLRHPGKRFTHAWYPQLSGRDVLGAPRRV